MEIPQGPKESKSARMTTNEMLDAIRLSVADSTVVATYLFSFGIPTTLLAMALD